MKTYLTAAFLLLAVTLAAQLPDGMTITAEPDPLILRGNTIPIALKVDVQPRCFGKKSILILKPSIHYNGGETELDPILFRGEKVNGHGHRVSYVEVTQVLWRDTVAYQQGMEIPELVVVPFYKKQAGSTYQDLPVGELIRQLAPGGEIKVAYGLITTGKRVVHTEKILPAPHQYKGSLNESRMANLFFDKDDTHIDTNLPMNRVRFVKQQLEMLFAPLRSGWRIDTVVITAYTSPEGDSLHNVAIATKRAAAGKKYVGMILETFSADTGFLTILETGGEDWEGLSKTLMASALPGKERIIDIIENQPDTDKRMEEIMQQTQLSQDVETIFLPMLRRVSIRIMYSEPHRSDQEILDLAMEKPASLLFEQLMYAATLTKDPDQQLRIFQRANALYPEEWEAPHNAACIYLQRNQPEEAIVYLNQAQTLFPFNGVTLNNLAVASLMLERPDKAHQYLNRAEKEGIDVSYNRGIWYLLMGEFENAAAVLQDFDCDINAGLAALMTGQTEQAVRKLTCAAEAADGSYLLAIAEARKGNEKASAGHLAKAITLDPIFRITAANDIEFQACWSEEWFQKLIDR